MPGGSTGFVGEMRRTGNALLLRGPVIALICFLREVPETKSCSFEEIQQDLVGAPT